MEVKASLNNLRISPRKTRLVAGLIRNQPVGEALRRLEFCQKKSARPLKKLVDSALANARHNFKVDNTQGMVVKEIRVDEAPTLKRWRFVSRGKTHRIRKRVSNVQLILAEMSQEKQAKRKEAKG